jgi:tRNA(Ser,Leu) C12 N-acetylase TAN1
MKQQEYDRILEIMDRVIKKSDEIDSKIQFLLDYIKETKTLNTTTEKKVYDAKESDIMKKFNDWMIKKDPKMDDSIFNNAEGEEDNF